MKLKISFLFFVVIPMFLFGQENTESKFRINVGYGFFNSTFYLADNNGDYLEAGFGYKINEDFWLNIDVVKISSTGNFESDPLFLNTPVSYSNTMIAPNFSKDWDLSNKLMFSASLGGALIFERVYSPYVNFTDNDFEGIAFSDEGEFNIGLYGNLSLKYKIIDNLYLGVNLKSYLPMYLDIETFMIGASVEIRI